MTTIQKTINWWIIFKNNNITVNTMFNMWKIWLTKREIADIYWVKKSEIKRELNNILLNSNLDLVENVQKIYNEIKDKKETFYSLDVLLLLWYNSKHYKETKFLINTNKIIKDYTLSRKHNSISTPIFKKIFNYLNYSK